MFNTAFRKPELRILVNHIGYDARGIKTAILQADHPIQETSFAVMLEETGRSAFQGNVEYHGPVVHWNGWHFSSLDFTPLREPGKYIIFLQLPSGQLHSPCFPVEEHHLAQRTLSDILYYFRGQRHTGELAEYDKRAVFAGDRRLGTVDVRGGWCDATADWSKNLSHLNHANYMNPQQTPLSVWALAGLASMLTEQHFAAAGLVACRAREEAAYGADALVRMQDADGSFYEMAFLNRREGKTIICDSGYAYNPEMRDSWQAGFRQGGGMAIAALARCASLELQGEFTADDYRVCAIKGFDHLVENNTRYLNDGRENLLDDYCALLAAVELYIACNEQRFLDQARSRVASLCARVSANNKYSGWLRVDQEGRRPFFHASDEGIPVVALLRYLEVEREKTAPVWTALRRIIDGQLDIAREVCNPFRYMRQLTRAYNEIEFRTRFFMPHENETRYWWQGENARIASLACSLLAYRAAAVDADPDGALLTHAQSQCDWILGLNPFDVCMLHGHGWNNADYIPNLPNAPGGICNGITADPDNEDGIAFLSGPHRADPKYTWRWAEQWLPHASWFLLASALMEKNLYP